MAKKDKGKKTKEKNVQIKGGFSILDASGGGDGTGFWRPGEEYEAVRPIGEQMLVLARHAFKLKKEKDGRRWAYRHSPAIDHATGSRKEKVEDPYESVLGKPARKEYIFTVLLDNGQTAIMSVPVTVMRKLQELEKINGAPLSDPDAGATVLIRFDNKKPPTEKWAVERGDKRKLSKTERKMKLQDISRFIPKRMPTLKEARKDAKSLAKLVDADRD